MKEEHIIQVNSERCIGCGLCQKDCPENNIVMAYKKAEIRGQACIKCGHCVAICPKAAVTMTGFDQPPVEITAPKRLSPQTLLEAIRTRRSIRHFTDQAVEAELITQVIEAGRLTPTGGNAQDVSFLVLRDGLDQFEQTAVRLFRRLFPLVKLVNPMAKHIEIDDHFFFKQAPVAIVVVSPNPVNGALAASNMALMAEACGLGVLYSGFFAMAVNRSRTLRKQLGLHRGQKSVTALVLGYSATVYRRTAQKEAADIRWL